MDERRPKQITVRVTKQDFAVIQREAYSEGQEIGPMIAAWVEARMKRLRAKHLPVLQREL